MNVTVNPSSWIDSIHTYYKYTEWSLFIAQVSLSHAYGVDLNQVLCGWLVWIVEQGPQIYSDKQI